MKVLIGVLGLLLIYLVITGKAAQIISDIKAPSSQGTQKQAATTNA